MARIFTCGFEENNVLETMWTTVAIGSPTIQSTTKGSGTYAARFNQGAGGASHGISRSLSAADTAGTYSLEFWLRVADFPDTLPQSLFIWGNTNSGATGSGPIHVRLTTGPKLQIRNVLTATNTDGTTTLSINTDYHVSLKVVLGDSPNGSVELRLDGAVEASQTSTDTLESTFGFQKFFVGLMAGGEVASANYDIFIDDLRINDETGTFETGYPTVGSKIALVKPASDNTVAWERTGGITNADSVDDLPGTPDDLTTYNSEAVTLNSVDRLNITALPAEVPSDADMILMDVYARIGSNQASAASLRLKIWDESSTLTDGPTAVASTNGWELLLIGPNNEHQVFDLGMRTKGNVEAFNLGYENITDIATRERRITALWANVEWIESAEVQSDFDLCPGNQIHWQAR